MAQAVSASRTETQVTNMILLVCQPAEAEVLLRYFAWKKEKLVEVSLKQA